MANALTQAKWEGAIIKAIQPTVAQTWDSVQARRAGGLTVLQDIIPMRVVPRTDKVRWPADFSPTGGGVVDRATGVPSANTPTEMKQAELSWATYDSTFEIGMDLLDLDPASLPAADVEAVVYQATKAVQGVYKNIEDALMGTGTDGSTIIGLLTAIAGTGSYAGLDRSTYPYWASLIESSSTYLDRAALQTFLASYRTAPRNGGADVAITGYARFQQIHAELESSLNRVIPNTIDMGGAPLPGLDFEGVKIIPVNNFPNTKMRVFSRNNVEVQVQSQTPVLKALTGGDTYNQRYGLIMTAQLKVTDPYRCGGFDTLANS